MRAEALYCYASKYEYFLNRYIIVISATLFYPVVKVTSHAAQQHYRESCIFPSDWLTSLIISQKQSSSSRRLSVAEVNDLEGTSINLFAFGLSIPVCLQIQAIAIAINNTTVIHIWFIFDLIGYIISL